VSDATAVELKMTTAPYGTDAPEAGYLIVKTYERMYRETYERM
jgi:hypothetical protein